MDAASASIGNLAVPRELVNAIDDGRWIPPQDDRIITDVFGDEPDDPRLYDLPTMARQNQRFQSKSQVALASDIPGAQRGLGIDPTLAVLIGDLGADMPIALDYRTSETRPRVIYFGADGWHEVAPDIETLLRRLGLSGRP
jgi:hypothetical protein